MRDYIPSTDAALAAWSFNFNTVITANPTDYGLIAGQATAYDTLDDAFQAALTAATNPGTRTPVTVAAKDVAKAALIASARQLGQIARKYPGVTNELLSEAGLTVPDPIPSPIPAPSTVPVLSLIASGPLSQVIRFRDSVLSNPRSKPEGVVSMQLFVKIGLTPPATKADCTFVGNFSKMPMTVGFSGADALKNAYYIGHWVNAKGEIGPQSDVLMVTIAG